MGDKSISRIRNKLLKCAQLVYYPGIHECARDGGTNRETTGEGPGLRKQPVNNNRGS